MNPDFGTFRQAQPVQAGGRRSIGGISLLLAVALACSGAVGANQNFHLAAIGVAVDAARYDTGLPRQALRSVTVRREIVPAVPQVGNSGCRSRCVSIPVPAAKSGRAYGFDLAHHLVDMPPPQA